MKIFITGATGFVGSSVLKYLLETENEIFVLYRSEKTFSEQFKAVIQNKTNVNLVKGDVLDKESMKIAAECDVTLFLACNSRWGTLETESTLNIATVGTRNCLEIVGPNKRFVYVSSAAAMMFDADFDQKQFLEMDKINKNEFIYSKAKYGAEQIVKELSQNYVILRPGEIYDREDFQLITAQNVIDYMRQPAICIKGGVSITNRQSVAKTITEAAFTAHSNQLYSLGGDNITIGELARSIQKVSGHGHMYFELGYKFAFKMCKFLGKFGIKLFELEAVKYCGFNWFVDSEPAKEKLGYVVGSSEEILEEVVDWLNERTKSQKQEK
ncbi:Nucleoside-diphosphate-sugar_epimerase [Hexamita inflata]|uniref:Nucleoside-diphosphate-sugar epimerase n=1 Tax=Hexamita inflata TaxID=28002 RepID=A0AA86P8B9_9EUKA|nr:Nucleoside-diphosphate-sugar epimerase [Hexamita inflata]